MREKDFIFKRDVESSTAKEIYYITDNVTADLDCFSLVRPEDMHLSIAHQSMLRNRKTPKKFNPAYELFDANRKIFARSETLPTPWENVALGYEGTEMLKYTLAIKTDLPAWLANERRRILRVANIQKEHINFSAKDYQPHISVAYFVGEVRDLSCIGDVERELHLHFKDIGEIALMPLNFKNSDKNWTFLPANQR